MHFDNPYNHDFARVAVAVPRVRVADPAFNAERTCELLAEAGAQSAAVVVFPELGLSGYSCDDLFHQRALLDASEAALARVLQASRGVGALAVVGLPVRFEQRLFNCAAVLHRGRLLGLVPKSFLPTYGEFYEQRQFQAADAAVGDSIELCGQRAPFGTHLLFAAQDLPRLVVGVEICEDLWVPVPPSSLAALAGATVLLNASASSALVGKADYRRTLVSQQSARCLAAYAFAAAGAGESSNDLSWDGQALICENGELLIEGERFVREGQLHVADVDLERVERERMRLTTFGASVRAHATELARYRRVSFQLNPVRDAALPLARRVARWPFVPAERAHRNERCAEIYAIQLQALQQRLESSGIKRLVIGVSGGLDSTQALLVAARAFDRMGLPRSEILGVTMPGFATSERTRAQALGLMKALGVSAREIDIRPSCLQMLRDIGHPFANGEPKYDVTFENVQAGERTSHLFRIANLEGALVLGTGDLSELALGWCTYGVGDHMSHYNVNAGVPKTLIQHLVRWVAETGQLGAVDAQVLLDVLDTEISPELVPGNAPQSTEAAIGPYELQDFHLHHVLRNGFAPAKIAYLARQAWGDKYDGAELKRVLGIFVRRFFQSSQFKRSCVPNAPKVGSVSLSPRGDWRAPSDALAATWLEDLDRIPD